MANLKSIETRNPIAMGVGRVEKKACTPGSFPNLGAGSKIITPFREKNEVCWRTKHFLGLWGLRPPAQVGWGGGCPSSTSIRAPPPGSAVVRGLTVGCHRLAHKQHPGANPFSHSILNAQRS